MCHPARSRRSTHGHSEPSLGLHRCSSILPGRRRHCRNSPAVDPFAKGCATFGLLVSGTKTRIIHACASSRNFTHDDFPAGFLSVAGHFKLLGAEIGDEACSVCLLSRGGPQGQGPAGHWGNATPLKAAFSPGKCTQTGKAHAGLANAPQRFIWPVWVSVLQNLAQT